MEPRLLIAYSLMTASTVVAAGMGWIATRRSAERKRRLRGIKDHERRRPG